MTTRPNWAYAQAARAHEIANTLGIEFGAAWRVANCVNKARFMTEDKARDYAADKGHGGQRPYQCDICGGWHNAAE